MNIQTRSSIILWLFSGCFLIFTMVVVGGITRLTGSGLSITRWDVVTGTVPPLNETSWQKEFDHYRESPQFKEINSHFGLEDFKEIYWWEYIHRLLGRLIGLVFVIPFTWFLIKGYLSKELIWKSLLLFGLGGLQGFIGWYMVKSGLVDVPSVSHFRLALHLMTAFITFGLTFWFALELIHTEKYKAEGWIKRFYNYTILIFGLLILQIIYGAFVAGMKAGYIYNTWPLMGDKLIADSFFFAITNMGWNALVNNLAGVQVVHRYLAYVVVLGVVFLYFFVRKKQSTELIKMNNPQLQSVNFLMLMVFVQFLLGVFTLIYNVPVVLGVLHQVGAFFLFASMIYLLHRLKRQSVPDASSQIRSESGLKPEL